MMRDGISCGERLKPGVFAELKERAVREAFKWNITDNGCDRLCDFPILLERPSYDELSNCAVELAAEAERAEWELLNRPLLQVGLGIPRELRRALRAIPPQRTRWST